MSSASGAPTRWGIVGPGEIARVFATALGTGGVGEVTAVTGGGPGRAAAFVEQFGGRAVAELAEVLQDVDALYVAAPHPFHAAAVRAGLRAGRAVLCEKPMTTTAEETAELIGLSRELRVPLVEAYMYRTHPVLERCLELVRSGAIGNVRRVESCFGFEAPVKAESRLFAPSLGGGAILDVGGYPVSLAMAVALAAGATTARPELVRAGGELAPTGVDAWAEATLRFDSGLEAHCSVAITRELGRSAILHGERGRIRFEDPFLAQGERLGLVNTLHLELEGEARSEVLKAERDGYAAEALEVRRLLERRTPSGGPIEPDPPMVTHEESVALAETLAGWKAVLGKAARS